MKQIATDEVTLLSEEIKSKRVAPTLDQKAEMKSARGEYPFLRGGHPSYKKVFMQPVIDGKVI